MAGGLACGCLWMGICTSMGYLLRAVSLGCVAAELSTLGKGLKILTGKWLICIFSSGKAPFLNRGYVVQFSALCKKLGTEMLL